MSGLRKPNTSKRNSGSYFIDDSFFIKLFHNIPTPKSLSNLSDRKFVDVNEAWEEFTGFSKDEVIGFKVEDLDLIKIHVADQIMEALEKTKRVKSFEVELKVKSGEIKYGLATFQYFEIKEVDYVEATILDITELKIAHEKLQTTDKYSEKLAIKSIEKRDVILELSNIVGSDYKKALRRILALSANILNVERVSLWKFDKNGTEIQCEKLFNLKKNEFESGLVIKLKDNIKYFEALNENKTICINNALNNAITKGFTETYLMPFGISSMLDVFVQGKQNPYGIICFEHVGIERTWTAVDEEFATSIAGIMALIIERFEHNVTQQKLIDANTDLINLNKELVKLKDQLMEENIYLKNEIDLVFNYEEMIYGSEVFSNVLTQVEKVAPTNATVLLLGESGTGKELLARAIHNIGLRNNKPLIKVNCSAIPRELIESELFGHKKGSFTGAVNDKIGKFELADGGTLFLDEIGELPLDMQPKILRFLQDGEIEVVGGVGIKNLDVRVIAATNRNLKEEIEKKKFREDLFFRLNVFPIKVPPLRQRKDDVPLLVEHFVDKFNKAYMKNIKYVSDAAMGQLKVYNWPGNIRELENLIERAVILSDGDTLVIPGIESPVQKTRKDIKARNLSLAEAQRIHILQVLGQCKWKIGGVNGAAVLLDVKPSTLRDRMKKLNIKKPTK